MAKSENAFFIGFGALALLLASLPYLYGFFNEPKGYSYTGLTYNIDDAAVYLSWIRQAADGHLFQRNLFNTDPQRGAIINLFALPLGWLAALTGLSLPTVYHLGRVGCGAALLWAAARLIQETLADGRARRIAFAFLCVGSGLGWITGGYDPAKGDNQSIDLWQPEAITFLSLYYTPLFLAALALMVVFFLAVLRSERTGKIGDIWPAAVSAALLGNFHPYDLLPVFGVWTIYRIVTDAIARRINLSGWARLIIAGVAALPTAGYTYYALIKDPLFAGRNVVTHSAAPPYVFLGFGLILVFAALAILPRARAAFADSLALRLLTVWAVVGILLPYLPFDFQRKLLMGAQIPLCLLSGGSVAALTASLSGDFPKIAAAFAVLITVPSNALFLLRDIGRLDTNVGSTENQPYLHYDEEAALSWLRKNAPRSDGILVSPDPTSHKRFPFFPLRPYRGVFVPAWTGNPVYIGHGSETAAYGRKTGEMLRFFRADTDDAWRRDFLQTNHIRYILYNQGLDDGTPTDTAGNPFQDAQGPYTPVSWYRKDSPDYLKPVFHIGNITIFQVAAPSP